MVQVVVMSKAWGCEGCVIIAVSLSVVAVKAPPLFDANVIVAPVTGAPLAVT